MDTNDRLFFALISAYVVVALAWIGFLLYGDNHDKKYHCYGVVVSNGEGLGTLDELVASGTVELKTFCDLK